MLGQKMALRHVLAGIWLIGAEFAGQEHRRLLPNRALSLQSRPQEFWSHNDISTWTIRPQLQQTACAQLAGRKKCLPAPWKSTASG